MKELTSFIESTLMRLRFPLPYPTCKQMMAFLLSLACLTPG